jgi:hypothetical protein
VDSLVTATSTVLVTVHVQGDGNLSWVYDENPASHGTVIKQAAGDVLYVLKNSPGFQFCAPPEIDNDPDHQLINPSYTPGTARVTDIHTVSTGVPMSLYLHVRGPDGKMYRSSDPQIINTEG